MNKRWIFATPLLCAAAFAARADLTVTGVNTSNQGTEAFTIYLKDDQMRMDSGDQYTMLIRPSSDGSHEYVFLDHAQKQAMIMPRAMADEAESAVDASTENLVSVVDGEEDTILGYPVSKVEYVFEGSASAMPAGAGQGQEIPPELAEMMTITMLVNGTSWVAPDADGANEFAEFYRNIGSEMGNVNGVAGLTRGLTASMLRVAEHGLPLRTTTTTELEFQVNASGPMRAMVEAMASRMPNMKSTSTSEVQEISTDSVDAALFFGGDLPEGYSIETL